MTHDIAQKPARTISYTFYSDPCHGWAKVPMRDLIALGVADKISRYSYQRGEFAYLEEDSDYSIFLAAARAARWAVSLKDKTSDNLSRIRGYAKYQCPPNAFTLQLYLVSGRVCGDDDDTAHVVVASTSERARWLFVCALREDDGEDVSNWTPDRESLRADSGKPIFINQNLLLGRADPSGAFIIDPASVLTEPGAN